MLEWLWNLAEGVGLALVLYLSAVFLLAGLAVLPSHFFYWYDDRNRNARHPWHEPNKLRNILRGLYLVGREWLWHWMVWALSPLGWFDRDRAYNRHRDPQKPIVILVHGYGQNRACMFRLRRALAKSGQVGHIHTINLWPSYGPIEDMAQLLDVHVNRIRYDSGQAKIHLIGHSMGGLVIRYWAQAFGGAEKLGVGMCIGSPHGGSQLSMFMPGRNAAQMMPRSEFLNALNRGAAPSGPHWVDIASQHDNVVFPADAQVWEGTSTRLRLLYIGHFGLLWDRRALDAIVEQFSEGLQALAAPPRLASRPSGVPPLDTLPPSKLAAAAG